MTNMKCCKISESKILTQVNKVDIRMKKKRSSSNKRKLMEQDVKPNDLKSNAKKQNIPVVVI